VKKLLALLLFAAACKSGSGGPPTVRIEEPFARPVIQAGGVGAVYLDLVNGTGADDRLVSASSPIAGDVETHESVQEGDIAKMVARPEGFVVPAGGTVSLKPGGKHLMLFDVRQPVKAGEAIPLQLRFEKAGIVEVQVPVRAE
jgi:copper(I)-binding protein